jgi:hypothetical protein
MCAYQDIGFLKATVELCFTQYPFMYFGDTFKNPLNLYTKPCMVVPFFWETIISFNQGQFSLFKYN